MTASSPSRLTVFSLVMMTVISVDSIRNLPATALFGASVVTFFSLAALLFLIPAALASAHLASMYPRDHGVYHWVGRVLGQRWGVMAIWLQWIENVIWYPTLLAFVAGTLGYALAPNLATQPWFLTAVILVTFWALTALNVRGIQAAAWFSHACTWFGLLVPMALVVAGGVAWLWQGHPSAIAFTPASFWPHWNLDSWVSLSGVMLSFCGIELTTVHANDVKDPERSFPKALLISSAIIWGTLVSGSLAISVVIPHGEISLVAGIMQTFDAFLSAHHLRAWLPLAAMMLVVGGLGGVMNWIIAPARGLCLAAEEGHLPACFARTNANGAPTVLLWAQAGVVSLVSLLFLWLPSVNTSYWVMTVLAVQLYMGMYLLLFVTCWRARPLQACKGRFCIPGGGVGKALVCTLGMLACAVTWIIGFVPPERIQSHHPWHYALGIALGVIALALPPLGFPSRGQGSQALADTVDPGTVR